MPSGSGRLTRVSGTLYISSRLRVLGIDRFRQDRWIRDARLDRFYRISINRLGWVNRRGPRAGGFLHDVISSIAGVNALGAR
jgi:hypothetical protein